MEIPFSYHLEASGFNNQNLVSDVKLLNTNNVQTLCAIPTRLAMHEGHNHHDAMGLKNVM